MTDLTPEERRQIYAEEKASIDAAEVPTVAPPLMHRRIIMWAAGLLVAVIGGGILSYQLYRIHEVKQKLGEAIGKDQGLTETVLKIESDSSKITFAEVFELCNKSVESRTNLIVELRGLHPEMDYQLKTRLVDYLSTENDFVRAKRDYYRTMMEESSATQLYVNQLTNPPSSVYGWDFYSSQLRQLKAKTIEAVNAFYKSADDFLGLYGKLTLGKRLRLPVRHAECSACVSNPSSARNAPPITKRLVALMTKAGVLQLAQVS